MNGVDASTVGKDGSLRRTISLKDDLIENGVTGVGKRWYKQWVDSFLFTFIGFHYVYIIGAAIIGSVITYGARNMAYIDALFMATSSSTQSGMNVVDVNNTKLYQQLTWSFLQMMTNSMVINSGLVFFRLYWFERSFKDYKMQFKQMSRLRRTATTLSRASTLESVGSASRWALFRRARTRTDDGVDGVRAGGLPPTRQNTNVSQDNEHAIVEDDDYDEKAGAPGTGDSGDSGETVDGRRPPASRDIRFGDLPQPHPKYRQGSLAPQDMIKSINMMQRARRISTDDGPALVIKSPRDIENETDNGAIVETPTQLRRRDSASSDGDDDDDDDAAARNRLRRARSYDVSARGRDSGEGSMHRSGSGDRNDATGSSGGGGGGGGGGDGDEPMPRALTFDVQRPKRSNSDNLEDGGPRRHGSTARRMTSRTRTGTIERMLLRRNSSESRARNLMSTNYLSWTPTVGRNSAFVDLTPEQKMELR